MDTNNNKTKYYRSRKASISSIPLFFLCMSLSFSSLADSIPEVVARPPVEGQGAGSAMSEYRLDRIERMRLIEMQLQQTMERQRRYEEQRAQERDEKRQREDCKGRRSGFVNHCEFKAANRFSRNTTKCETIIDGGSVTIGPFSFSGGDGYTKCINRINSLLIQDNSRCAVDGDIKEHDCLEDAGLK
ncbi:hypothetical protein [Marinimicrobium sp. C2-29]|uniref:hypothetical protein n=1 Tax=Marinimicrobium sp. C2-29 TaxID=3139825 RepID=UPI0031396B5F